LGVRLDVVVPVSRRYSFTVRLSVRHIRSSAVSAAYIIFYNQTNADDTWNDSFGSGPGVCSEENKKDGNESGNYLNGSLTIAGLLVHVYGRIRAIIRVLIFRAVFSIRVLIQFRRPGACSNRGRRAPADGDT